MVGCNWCDTKYTWHKNITEKDILLNQANSSVWSHVSDEDIIAIIMQQGWTTRHVVITGGEPCMHNLLLITYSLE